MDYIIQWKYSYFVSYWAMSDPDHTGYGWSEYNTDRPLSHGERVKEVEQKIVSANPHFSRVVVLHWQPFEETE